MGRKHSSLKTEVRKSQRRGSTVGFSSDPSVDEIVAQYLKVSGWEANPSALKNFVGKGRFQIKNEPGDHVVETMDRPHISVHFHWDSVDGEIEFEADAPDKFVITQKYDNTTISQRGTNGTAGWWRTGFPDRSTELNPHMPLMATFHMDELRGDRLTDLKRGSDFINYFQLLNKYPRLYLTGKTMVGDRVAYELTNRNFPDAVSEMYFDVETGMLLKFTSYRPGLPYLPMFARYYVPFSNNSNWAETYLEDYREVNGVRLPFLVRQHIHRYWITTLITDFKTNVSIDPSVFEKPGS